MVLLRGELDAALEKSLSRLSTTRKLCAKLDRKKQCRTEAELELCERTAAAHSRASMKSSIARVIGTVGEDDEISTVSLMTAIKEGGYLDAVWESELIWGLRMSYVVSRQQGRPFPCMDGPAIQRPSRQARRLLRHDG